MLTGGNQKNCIPPQRVGAFRTILERVVTKLTCNDHSTSKGNLSFSGRKTPLDISSNPSAIFELSNHDLHYFHYQYFPCFGPATFPCLGPAAAVTCLLACVADTKIFPIFTVYTEKFPSATQANVFRRLATVVVPVTLFPALGTGFIFFASDCLFLLQINSLSYSPCSSYWSRVTKQSIEAHSLK